MRHVPYIHPTYKIYLNFIVALFNNFKLHFSIFKYKQYIPVVLFMRKFTAPPIYHYFIGFVFNATQRFV